jgi:hypothetical protein
MSFKRKAVTKEETLEELEKYFIKFDTLKAH